VVALTIEDKMRGKNGEKGEEEWAKAADLMHHSPTKGGTHCLTRVLANWRQQGLRAGAQL